MKKTRMLRALVPALAMLVGMPARGAATEAPAPGPPQSQSMSQTGPSPSQQSDEAEPSELNWWGYALLDGSVIAFPRPAGRFPQDTRVKVSLSGGERLSVIGAGASWRKGWLAARLQLEGGLGNEGTGVSTGSNNGAAQPCTINNSDLSCAILQALEFNRLQRLELDFGGSDPLKQPWFWLALDGRGPSPVYGQVQNQYKLFGWSGGALPHALPFSGGGPAVFFTSDTIEAGGNAKLASSLSLRAVVEGAPYSDTGRMLGAHLDLDFKPGALHLVNGAGVQDTETTKGDIFTWNDTLTVERGPLGLMLSIGRIRQPSTRIWFGAAALYFKPGEDHLISATYGIDSWTSAAHAIQVAVLRYVYTIKRGPYFYATVGYYDSPMGSSTPSYRFEGMPVTRLPPENGPASAEHGLAGEAGMGFEVGRR